MSNENDKDDRDSGHEQRISSLEARVGALEGGAARSARRNEHDLSPPERARRHLRDGNLDGAGEALKLHRAHGGMEDDESYERRLRASVEGAEHSDAVRPRESTHLTHPADAEKKDEEKRR
jgi:hypothetical protein